VEPILKFRVIGVLNKLVKLRQVRQVLVGAECLFDELCETWVALEQPTSWGNAFLQWSSIISFDGNPNIRTNRRRAYRS
jgi:hypothetical protein